MRIVLTNVPSGKGKTIAQLLIQERLAACVNLYPIRSFYRWEGQVCDDAEETLLIKVGVKRLDALRSRLLEVHPYDLPEIVAIPVDSEASLEAYIRWVQAETPPTQPDEG